MHSFAHALPGRWYAMAAMLNGAGTLAFASRLFGVGVADLEREAAVDYRGPGELMFLPYLSGERTPLDDPYARGVLFGLSETTSRAEVTRAVMEGVAFSLAEARDCLAAAGAPLSRVGLHGGGARSDLWTRMIAAATGLTIARMRGGAAGPALGAARLARLAFTGETPAQVCPAPEIADVTEPDRELAAIFERKRATLHQSLSRAESGISTAIARFTGSRDRSACCINSRSCGVARARAGQAVALPTILPSSKYIQSAISTLEKASVAPATALRMSSGSLAMRPSKPDAVSLSSPIQKYSTTPPTLAPGRTTATPPLAASISPTLTAKPSDPAGG